MAQADIDGAFRDQALLAERAAERRAEQHRLRNILAVVRSLVRRAGDTAASVEEYQLILDGRLAAFFGVQSALSLAPERGLDLAGLIADQLLRFGIRIDDHVVLEGAPVRLTGRAAGLLALVFHELSADLIHCSDPAALPGALAIAWQRDGDGLRLRWTGARGQSGAHQSIDWIAEALVYELDGRVDIERDGGKHGVVVTLPNAALIDDPDSARTRDSCDDIS